MSYLALARKWRPRTFSQLIGQEHINKALINALNQQRLHHAYLFTGTRGVGKTSVARILAKSLNCDIGISPEPCLKCEACVAIEQGRFIDLIEIDGASKTRVEDTRDLLDNVQYAPASGRFKIYLIDEVHMLSQHSFNALLKTLEEPPPHVKFILATTDPQKLPVTVLSRCLQFNLKHLASNLISSHLQTIMDDEQLNFEQQAIDILAHAARGSMRDALSLLDQAITSCDDSLRVNDVKAILGYTQQDYAAQLLQAIQSYNASKLLSISYQIKTEGGHFQYVLEEQLNYLHQMAIYQNVGDHNLLINPTPEIKMLAQQFSAEDVQLFYQIALKGCEEIHLAPTLEIGFNMTLLRMLTFRPALNIVSPPIDVVQDMLEPTAPESEKRCDLHVEPNLAATEMIPIKEIPPSIPAIINQELIIENKDLSWSSIISQLKLTGLALNAIENTELLLKEGRQISLRVAKGHQSLFTPTVLTRIEQALGNYYQEGIKITLNTDNSVQSSPAQQKEQATQQRQEKAEAALQSDPMFQQLQKEFSAELVKNSIVPQ